MVTAMLPGFEEDDYDTPATTMGRGQAPNYQQLNALRSTQHQQNLKGGICILDKSHKNKQQSINTAPPNIIYLMAMLSAMGGFLFGYDTGIVSGAMVFVKKTFELNNLWQEIVVSITVLGAWIFSLMAGSLSETYGRKILILVASVIFAIGSILMGFAWSKWVLLFGRLTVGVAIGLASTVVPMYIAEVAPSNIRGSLVTLNNCFITFGQLCAAITAGAFSYDKENGWRWMLSIAAVPALLQFIGFMFMPESPRWLIKRRRDDEALEALKRIRGPKNPNIKREFDMIKLNSDEVTAQKARRKEQKRNIIMSILRKTATRRALIVGCLLMSIQQLAGINTLMYYNATIIQMSGVQSQSTAVWLAVPTAGVYMLFSASGYFLADRVGRRTLTLGSLLGVIISLLVLGTGFHLTSLNGAHVHMHNMTGHEPCNIYQECYQCVANLKCGFCYDPHDLASTSFCLLRNPEEHSLSAGGLCSEMGENSTLIFASQVCPSDSQGISANTWLVLGGLIMYLAAFAPGMGPMPWTINSEIYPMWARGVCYSLATSVNWLFNMIISLTFLTLTESLTTHGTFYMYSIIASIGWLLLFWKLPETRGRSLEEVSSLFAKQKPDNEEMIEDGMSSSQSSNGGTTIGPLGSHHNSGGGVDNLGFNEESTQVNHQSRSFKMQSPLSKVVSHAIQTGAIPILNSNDNNNNSGSPSTNYPIRRYSNGRHPQAYLASSLSTSPDGTLEYRDSMCSIGCDGDVAFMHQHTTTNNNKRHKQPSRSKKSSPPQLHLHNTTSTTTKTNPITTKNNNTNNNNNMLVTTPIITITNSNADNGDLASFRDILNDNFGDDNDLGNSRSFGDGGDYRDQLISMVDVSRPKMSRNDHHHHHHHHHHQTSPTSCEHVCRPFARQQQQQQQHFPQQLRSLQSSPKYQKQLDNINRQNATNIPFSTTNDPSYNSRNHSNRSQSHHHMPSSDDNTTNLLDGHSSAPSSVISDDFNLTFATTKTNNDNLNRSIQNISSLNNGDLIYTKYR